LNFNWQGTYAKEPIQVPGLVVRGGAHFITPRRIRQPKQTPKLVMGRGTNDEMCIGIYEWVVIEVNRSRRQTRRRPSPRRCTIEGHAPSPTERAERDIGHRARGAGREADMGASCRRLPSASRHCADRGAAEVADDPPVRADPQLQGRGIWST
jgi:hypothetical protein